MCQSHKLNSIAFIEYNIAFITPYYLNIELHALCITVIQYVFHHSRLALGTLINTMKSVEKDSVIVEYFIYL